VPCDSGIDGLSRCHGSSRVVREKFDELFLFFFGRMRSPT